MSSVRALELVRTPPQRCHWCVRWGDLGLFYIQSDISECSETLLGHPAEEVFSVFEFKATIDGVMDANIVFGPS